MISVGAKVVETPGLRRYIQRRLGEVAAQVLAERLAKFFSVLLVQLPVEDGHAHAAFLSAGKKLISGASTHKGTFGELQAVLDAHQSSSSGDRLAVGFGNGSYQESKETTRVSLSVGLPFVKTLNDGGTIVANIQGNQGVKEDPVKRPTVGPLYGPRTDQGVGLLVWTDSGGRARKAHIRTVAGTGFFDKAIAAIR